MMDTRSLPTAASTAPRSSTCCSRVGGRLTGSDSPVPRRSSSGRSVGPAPSSNANSGSVAAASSARFCRSAGASSARCARSARISRSSPGRFLRVQPSSSRTPRSASAQRPRTIFPRRRPGERRTAGKIRRPHILAGGSEVPSPPSTAGASQVAPRRYGFGRARQTGGRRTTVRGAMQLCLMVEGQEGVTWTEWVALARTCEAHGIPKLFRSDHYLNLAGVAGARLAGRVGHADRAGRRHLDAAAGHDGLARHVPPPVRAGQARLTADRISDGRGRARARGRLESTVSTRRTGSRSPICAADGPAGGAASGRARQLDGHGDAPFSFDGQHYTLHELDAQPKPVQQPHPPL